MKAAVASRVLFKLPPQKGQSVVPATNGTSSRKNGPKTLALSIVVVYTDSGCYQSAGKDWPSLSRGDGSQIIPGFRYTDRACDVSFPPSFTGCPSSYNMGWKIQLMTEATSRGLQLKLEKCSGLLCRLFDFYSYSYSYSHTEYANSIASKRLSSSRAVSECL